MKNYKYSNTNGSTIESKPLLEGVFGGIKEKDIEDIWKEGIQNSNQQIAEIQIWLNGLKKSNNYLLDEGFKKHIDSYLDFAKSLKEKGVSSINKKMFDQSLINSNYTLIDFSTCVGSDDSINTCRLQKYYQHPSYRIILNMFTDLWNDDEKKRIAALEAKSIISKQQASKLQAEQDKKNTEAIEKQNQTLLLKTQLTALELQAKKEKNKKLMIGGAIAILTIIGGIIAYKKLT